MILGAKIGLTSPHELQSKAHFVEYICSQWDYWNDHFNLTYGTPISGKKFVAEIKWIPLSQLNDRFIFGGGQNSSPHARIGVDAGSANKTPVPIEMPNGEVAQIFTSHATVTEVVDREYCICKTVPLSSDVGIYLFAQEWFYSLYNPIHARLYRATFYDETESNVLMDLLPAKDSSGVACLIDKLSNTVYMSNYNEFVTNEEGIF